MTRHKSRLRPGIITCPTRALCGYHVDIDMDRSVEPGKQVSCLKNQDGVSIIRASLTSPAMMCSSSHIAKRTAISMVSAGQEISSQERGRRHQAVTKDPRCARLRSHHCQTQETTTTFLESQADKIGLSAETGLGYQKPRSTSAGNCTSKDGHLPRFAGSQVMFYFGCINVSNSLEKLGLELANYRVASHDTSVIEAGSRL